MNDVFAVRPARQDDDGESTPAQAQGGAGANPTPSNRSALTTPIQHLVEVASTHQVTMLGDQRGVAQHLDVLAKSIGPLHSAGVANLVWEFTNSRRQADLDQLCQGSEWDRRLAVALFVDLMGIGFGYDEYVDVLHAVWQHNQDRPQGWPPFRVVAAGLASYVEDPDLLDGRSAAETELRDWWLGGHYRDIAATHLANIVTAEVLRGGERAVVYADGPRTNTNLVEFVDSRPILTPGILLANWLGEGLARVVFHGAIDDSDALDRVEELIAASPDPESTFGLALDRSTLGSVRVHGLQGAVDGELAPFDLAELADGYLFVAPRSEWLVVTLTPDLLAPDTLKAAERRYRAIDPRDTAYTQAELELVRIEGHADLETSWPTTAVEPDLGEGKRRLFRRH
ncbi:MAG: hypothetical protein GXP35_04905 [Actinobacteria bacterium]|nr:hypothetical protein [Actinomycetota bacterium]